MKLKALRLTQRRCHCVGAVLTHGVHVQARPQQEIHKAFSKVSRIASNETLSFSGAPAFKIEIINNDERDRETEKERERF